MISQDTISSAVEIGVLTAEQAAQLIALENQRRAGGAEPEDDEKLRFISGFGDIFVVIGLALFLGAAWYFARQIGNPLIASAGVATLSWLLAEFFTRRRRMALPSIVLLLTFSIAVLFVSSDAIGHITGQTNFWNGWTYAPSQTWGITYAAAACVTALAIAVHYARFRVPITVAAGTGAAVLAVLALVSANIPVAGKLALFVLGTGVFALAMYYDLSDPQRVTRRTDIAFWLHMLAAPMIVHPLVASIRNNSFLDQTTAIESLAVFFVLGLVALAIDRRALLVSGLIYAGTSFAVLLKATGLTGDAATPATMLTLGAFVLALSAAWQGLRAIVLNLLPATLTRRLPHQPVSKA